MTFGQAIKSVFKRYATFQGRASRSEFWWWYLFTAIVSAILAIPYYIGLAQSASTAVVDPKTGEIVAGSLSGLAIFGLVLVVIWSLAIIIPTIAVAARRLHDTDRTAWWLLLYFLACCAIGPIILIIFWVMPSTMGPNRFGEGPEGPVV